MCIPCTGSFKIVSKSAKEECHVGIGFIISRGIICLLTLCPLAFYPLAVSPLTLYLLELYQLALSVIVYTVITYDYQHKFNVMIVEIILRSIAIMAFE